VGTAVRKFPNKYLHLSSDRYSSFSIILIQTLNISISHETVSELHDVSRRAGGMTPNEYLPLLRTIIDLVNSAQNVPYLIHAKDHLCGLVVRVASYRSRALGFDSRRYQIFWEVVGMERGPLNLLSITEELLELKIGDPLRWPRDTLYPQKLALTSPTSGGRPVGRCSSLAG
jgi:hypothetical protein